jgi:flagellar biosynthesis/type III secretory pathway M-ring protein FliF/YscJ
MNEEFDNIEEFKKVNTKLITPLIVLSATAIIAVFTYFKHYPVGDWFIIVLSSVVIFLVIGLIIERMITRFLEINYEKALAEKEEAERLAEEARAAMEAEGGEKTEILEDTDIPAGNTF